MTLIRKLLFVFCSLLFSNITYAEERLPLAAGLWEITTRPDFKGIPAVPVPRKDRICLSESAIRDGAIVLFVAATCKVTGGRWNNDRLELAIFCPDAPPDARIPAELIADGAAFTSFIELNPQIRYNHSGKWLATECQ